MSRIQDATLSRVDERSPSTAGPTAPQLFLILEGDRPLTPSARFDLSRADVVKIGRGQTRAFERSRGSERVLSIRIPDPRMSSSHVELKRLHGRWIAEDQKSKNGSLVNGTTISSAALNDGDVLEIGHTFFLFRAAAPEPRDGREDLESTQLRPPRPELATFVEPLRAQLEALQRAAPSPLSVLILGESGTGKEVIARAIHELSRRSGSFIAVNCGAIPEHLIEAELFGAKKGAFSGADRDRTGLVQAANGGTLFLDELGDLPEASQAAFLRVLQEKEVLPVGSSEAVPVDFRLVAATHRDLEKLVGARRFRGDLLARINGLVIRLPALRDRREDLGMLIGALLKRLAPNRSDKISFAPAAVRLLLRYDWPYNVRELEKTLETALVLAGDIPIELEHLPEAVRTYTPGAKTEASLADLSDEDLGKRAELIKLLQEHRGNLAAVARVTGKARMQIHRWLKRYQIDPDEYR